MARAKKKTEGDADAAAIDADEAKALKRKASKSRKGKLKPVEHISPALAAGADRAQLRQVIHIGQRKTATTWLQAIMRTASEETKSFELVHGQARAWTSANSHLPATKVDWNGLVPFMEQWADRNAFISVESLISFDHEHMAKALAQALPHASVLVTTRSPAGYLRSAVSHAIRSGRRINPKKFARSFTGNSMGRTHDLVALVDAYSSAFGADRIRFLPFEMIRDNQPTFLAEVSAVFGMDIAQYAASAPQRRNFSPPDFFFGLVQHAGDRLEETDPEWIASPAWRALLKISAHATGFAKDLWPTLEKRVGRLGISYESPGVPKNAMEELREKLSPLRELPLYQPYLSEYGLA